MINIDISPLKQKLSQINDRVVSAFKTTKIGDVMKAYIGDYLSRRFPGSSHYSPNKVYSESGGVAVVDIPGASRAFHDIEIYPVKAEWLMFVVDDKFVKTKHVHQNQDPTILPTLAMLQDAVGKEIENIVKD